MGEVLNGSSTDPRRKSLFAGIPPIAWAFIVFLIILVIVLFWASSAGWPTSF
jgi:hypothetical protein